MNLQTHVLKHPNRFLRRHFKHRPSAERVENRPDTVSDFVDHVAFVAQFVAPSHVYGGLFGRSPQRCRTAAALFLRHDVRIPKNMSTAVWIMNTIYEYSIYNVIDDHYISFIML